MTRSSEETLEEIQKIIGEYGDKSAYNDDPLFADLWICGSTSTCQQTACTVTVHSPDGEGQFEVITTCKNYQSGFPTASNSPSDDLDLCIATWIEAMKEGVDTVTISVEGTVSDERMAMFSRQLANVCREKVNTLKSSSLYLKLDMEVEELIAIVNAFEPRVLDAIQIVQNTPDIWKIRESPTWRAAKKLLVDKLNNIPIRDFLNAEQFSTTVESADPEEVWWCIQEFIRKDNPRGSFFHIQTLNTIDSRVIIDKIGEKLRDEPIDMDVDGFPARFIHTQRFPMATEQHVFVVR